MSVSKAVAVLARIQGFSWFTTHRQWGDRLKNVPASDRQQFVDRVVAELPRRRTSLTGKTRKRVMGLYKNATVVVSIS